MRLSDIMGAAGLESWAELGLIVSLATFLGVVAYVLWARRGSAWERARHLPLGDPPEPPDSAATRDQGGLGGAPGAGSEASDE